MLINKSKINLFKDSKEIDMSVEEFKEFISNTLNPSNDLFFKPSLEARVIAIEEAIAELLLMQEEVNK